jgi:hypothetical protein
MKKIIATLGLILALTSCSDDKSPTQTSKGVESMYSWLNIDGGLRWDYDKQTHKRSNPWIDAEPEYGEYLITSDTSSIFKLRKVSDDSSSFEMNLSYDSTQAFMNSFSVGDNFIDPILKNLDFKRIKIADMYENEWSVDTLFYENIAIDDKNTFYGYIAFQANRLEDSTVVFDGVEKVLKRFQLIVRVIAHQKEKGYFFTVYPGYYFSLIDGVGFYQIRLWNHTNTAIAVQEFNYQLKDISQKQ